MNKVFMMGRLVADPEVRYGGANNTAVANFRIAVDRRFKREGEPDADFFRMTALGKQGEFVEKYLKKGTKVVVEAELRNNNYTNKEGQMVYQDQLVVNSIEFAESKKSQDANGGYAPAAPAMDAPADGGFMNIESSVEPELPFA